jgi:hypothetical protein
MTVPVGMGTPVEDSATSSTQVVTTWTALSSTVDIGGTAITSYELDWDAGTAQGTWTALVGYASPDTSTTFTVANSGSTPITPGATYYFRLRAANAIGWGAFGTSLAVIPSSLPS